MLISKVLSNRLAKVLGELISPTQSAFLKGRNIIDSPLVLNEIWDWAKRKGEKVAFFKIDIEKAFDSINWKFLISVLHNTGFPSKWRTWILGILFGGNAKVIINGSVTSNFKINRGLRQGDPLSPMLFILGMEGLNWLMKVAVEKGLFKGVSIPNGGPVVSHLFYADDAVFLGEVSTQNFHNLNLILQCFHLISGLKINYSKSKLYTVGTSVGEAESLARQLGCQVGAFPFPYLGLWVGESMKKTEAWKPVIDKFNERLSTWKASCLSLSGRVLLAKEILGSLPTYFMSLFRVPPKVLKILEGIRNRFVWGGSQQRKKIKWVAWDKMILGKKLGGLGIGGIKEANLALLSKWWWRWRNNRNSLWAKVIDGIHGTGREMGTIPILKSSNGVWKDIFGIHKDFRKYGLDLKVKIGCNLGSGNSILFWKEKWATVQPFSRSFPHAYKATKDKNCTVQEMWDSNSEGGSWKLSDTRGSTRLNSRAVLELTGLKEILRDIKLEKREDLWGWETGEKIECSVKGAREDLDTFLAGPNPSGWKRSRWNSWIPAKVNLFIWRAVLGRVATSDQLLKRGLRNIDSKCAMCKVKEESVTHVFCNCAVSELIWKGVAEWLHPPWPMQGQNVADLLRGPDSCSFYNKNQRKAGRVVVAATLWKIWELRNARTFRDSTKGGKEMIEEVKETSLLWLTCRANFPSLKLSDWNDRGILAIL